MPVATTVPPIRPVPSEAMVCGAEPNKVNEPIPTLVLPTDTSNLPPEAKSMLFPTRNDLPFVPSYTLNLAPEPLTNKSLFTVNSSEIVPNCKTAPAPAM